MPPAFLALYFGDLSILDDNGGVKDTCGLSLEPAVGRGRRICRGPVAGNLPVCVLIESFTVNQAVTVDSFSLLSL